MITQGILIGVVILLVVYDAIVGKIHQPSESTLIRQYGWQYNTIPFILGYCIGHWFFPRQHQLVPLAWGNGLPIILLLVIFDWYWNKYQHGTQTWFRYPGWYILLGIPAGSLLWGAINSNSPIW